MLNASPRFYWSIILFTIFLQNTTKCDSYFIITKYDKVWLLFYYKVRQNATIILLQNFYTVLISGHFFHSIPEYNLSYWLIFFERKSFRSILGIPTIWEYRYKISLRNIDIRRGITISSDDAQSELLIILYRVSF